MNSPYRRQLSSVAGRTIRILRLNPAPFSSEAPVSGVLEDISLDRATYDALSYQWRRDKPAVPIRINDVQVLVTQNCHAALRRLRDTHRKRVVWIDAICINQQDDLEKNHQAAMISDIYKRTLKVFVWLGESSEKTDYALQWCTQMSRISSRWLVAKVDVELTRIRAPRNIRRLWPFPYGDNRVK